MAEGYVVVVIGASGLVGQEFLKILSQRAFPVKQLRLVGSPRAVGRKVWFAHLEAEIGEIGPRSFEEADFVFFLADAESSAAFVPQAVRSGGLVVDCSRTFRLEPSVPLVVPEVNPQDVRLGLVASPNPCVTQLLPAIYPLHRVNPIKALTVDTLHAVSGTGSAAVEELSAETKQVLQGHPVVPHVYPHQIAFNLLPETDVFLDNGYTREEWSLMEETRKVLAEPNLAISATVVRAPLHIGNAQIIYAQFSQMITPEDARTILGGASGVKVLDDPAVNLYPQPWAVVGQDDVFVGRIREDPGRPYGLTMWTATDNLRKGVALNALQIAEVALERDLL